ncbi:NAD(P)-dependent oxidoreductase [Kribbella sp. NPDC026596]|uniref:NAD(P)-dependent oxidoreductase n=1 Tax=Kribbella sp. NPDC026596 TaxID=3155122 RepID=UPI0033E18800
MATSALPTIGFVGLGHMGSAMADRLLDAGYSLHGMSRTRERAEPLIARGLEWHSTPRDVAGAADVVLSSLPDDGALDVVASGPEGILAGLTPGKVWVDLSTVSPAASAALAHRVQAQDARLLDAPVSGSVPQVRSGTLTIMVGGDERSYARVEPILRVLGKPTHVGANGQGLALKLAINISLAVQILALSEGLLLADRSGIDRKLAVQVMTESAIGSPMLKARVPLLLQLPDEAWFEIRLMRKDLDLALDLGRGLGVPLPSTISADEVLAVARTLGFERRDIAAVFAVLDQLASDR